jgi:hypothetical protein
MRSNPSLDRKISEATDPTELRQLLHNHFEGAGVITHDRGDEVNYTVPQGAPASAPARELPARENFSQAAHRIIYPYGNLKLEISGVDEAALDAIEERVREALQR